MLVQKATTRQNVSVVQNFTISGKMDALSQQEEM
jgi:hypothetical protein